MSLHVLMYGWEYPPRHLGGLGVACQGLVRGLRSRGVNVTLVLPRAESITEAGCDIIGLPGECSETMHIGSHLQPYDDVQSFSSRHCRADGQSLYASDLLTEVDRYSAAAVRLTRSLSPGIVHAHDWMTFEAGIRSARYHRVPLVAHIHATELDRTYFRPNPVIFQREQRGFQQADRVIAVSHYTKQILMTHYGIPEQRIAVIHNGLTSLWSIKTHVLGHPTIRRPPLVLFVGRLVLQKGTHEFLKMAAAVHRQDPAVQFVMAGEGNLLPQLVDESVRLGLQDNLIFAGRLDQAEIRTLFSQAACFVMPSLSEPFGLVALEAAALNVPLVLSRQSGAREVLRDSFIVDFWDTEKMADCVLTVLRDRTLTAQLTARTRGVLHQLTWQHQAAIVESMYQSLIFA